MNFKAKYLWVCVICYLTVDRVFAKSPENELSRTKRSRTTICVEIQPSSSQDEPYYMCKGANVPVVKKFAKTSPVTKQTYSKEKIHNFKTYNVPKARRVMEMTEPHLNLDHEVSNPTNYPFQSASLLQQQLQFQPSAGYPAVDELPNFRPDFKVQREKEYSSLPFPDPENQQPQFQRYPSQTLQTQSPYQQSPQRDSEELFYRQAPNPFSQSEHSFQTQPTHIPPDLGSMAFLQRPENQGSQVDTFSRFQENEAETTNSFFPRRDVEFGRQSEKGSFSGGTIIRAGASLQFDEQLSPTFPAAWDKLVQMGGAPYEPSARVARPHTSQKTFDVNAENFPDQRSFVNPLSSNQFGETSVNIPADFLQNVSPMDLQTLFHPPTIPADYMDDPVLRTFYASLMDPLQPNMQTTNFNNNNAFQQVRSEPSPAENSKSSCAPCVSSQASSLLDANANIYSQLRTTNKDQKDLSISSRSSCPTQDLNWSPLVIAMPCCGQQPVTTPPPSSIATTAPNYFNPYALPPTFFGMFPSFVTPFNPAADNTNYSKTWNDLQQQNIQQYNSMINYGRSADNDRTSSTTNMITTTAAYDSMEDDDLFTESINEYSNDPVNETSNTAGMLGISSVTDRNDAENRKDMNNTRTEIAESGTTLEPDTTVDITENITTEINDSFKAKDKPPKAFEMMLNRAKTFKEMADAGVTVTEAFLNNNKKGKRQNTKDANAALRTIAEAVVATNKRKYSTL